MMLSFSGERWFCAGAGTYGLVQWAGQLRAHAAIILPHLDAWRISNDCVGVLA